VPECGEKERDVSHAAQNEYDYPSVKIESIESPVLSNLVALTLKLFVWRSYPVIVQS
jgi:hypothetical protein